jgi:hypothetical protein
MKRALWIACWLLAFGLGFALQVYVRPAAAPPPEAVAGPAAVDAPAELGFELEGTAWAGGSCSCPTVSCGNGSTSKCTIKCDGRAPSCQCARCGPGGKARRHQPL